MNHLRREPFRLFFPLGLLVGLAGVLPWLVFALGYSRRWPGLFHGLTMTQGYLFTTAAGFLLTLVPRRTGTPPPHPWEIAALAVAAITVPSALWLGALSVAEGVALASLLVLLRFALSRWSSPSRQPTPPSFVLLAGGATGGLLGGGLLLAAPLVGALAPMSLGRQLVQQGPLLGAALALTPFLTPVLAEGQGRPPAEPAIRRRQVRLHGLAGLLLLGSFAVEEWLSIRFGLLLRGLVCLVEVLLAGRPFAPYRRAGAHRFVYRVALILLPLGLLGGALAPAQRVPLAHLTYLGGFALLIYAVATHVVLHHTGRSHLAERSPIRLLLAALLTVAAAVVRTLAERFPMHYFAALAAAATLWLLGALLWGSLILPMLLPRRDPQA